MTGCSIRNQNGFPEISRLSVGRSGRAGCRWTRDWGAGSPPPRSGGQVFEVPSKLTAFQSVKSQIRLGDAFTSEIPNTRVAEQTQSSARILLAETALTQLREAERRHTTLLDTLYTPFTFHTAPIATTVPFKRSPLEKLLQETC